MSNMMMAPDERGERDVSFIPEEECTFAEGQKIEEEAEKMKALGNKHMSHNEFTRAYNAYSAALKLSPVGPSSHVFLSNRAAALLSMKRYSAAAADARRAIALAPSFGKAHARLGQSLYFLKDYEGAVEAYECAIQYEPNNQVTRTYWMKAKKKLEKHLEKERRREEEDVSIAASRDSTYMADGMDSIATDPVALAAVTEGIAASTNARLHDVFGSKVVASEERLVSPLASPAQEQDALVTVKGPNQEERDDPDYEEALRLQHRATNFLSYKKYRAAVEEYSAALFLVPDEVLLSPQLHIGRAHALNGLKRHEAATTDAKMALSIDPSSEGYSVLAKSLFYAGEYERSVTAFEKCAACLEQGESLGSLDEAYLKKARQALQDDGVVPSSTRVVTATSQPVPKLRPPRFVAREDLVASTPNLPPMPKNWPQQISAVASVLRVGPEREVTFFSESMGVKLNRGPDGVVRVLSVVPVTAGSSIFREGEVATGDVVREAAGVDMRRPITNVMWGDTVALIKLAPRPLTVKVASEESPLSPAVREELARAARAPADTNLSGRSVLPPTASNGAGPTRGLTYPSPMVGTEPVSACVGSSISSADDHSMLEDFPQQHFAGAEINGRAGANSGSVDIGCSTDDADDKSLARGDRPPPQDVANGDGGGNNDDDVGTSAERNDADLCGSLSNTEEDSNEFKRDILFEATAENYDYTNEWWLKTSSTRKLILSGPVTRLVQPQRGFGFGLLFKEQYIDRILALYRDPDVLFILRKPKDASEVHTLLRLPKGGIDGVGEETFLIAESVIDLNTCKIRLSHLTTPTSFSWVETDAKGNPNLQGDARRRSCFELITPKENVILSAIVPAGEANSNDENNVFLNNTGAYLETTAWETAIATALHSAHSPIHAGSIDDSRGFETENAWRHVIVIGTLHSFCVSGDVESLKRALDVAFPSGETAKEQKSSILNERDSFGLTPLMYACTGRRKDIVSTLVASGANCNATTPRDLKMPSHLSAECLDERSLSVVLSATFPSRPDPNSVDALGQTPMYKAAVHGKAANGDADDVALDRCLSALQAWGGQFFVPLEAEEVKVPLVHPIASKAAEWRAKDIAVIFQYVNYFYPLVNDDSPDGNVAISIAKQLHYPIHIAFIALRKQIAAIRSGKDSRLVDSAGLYDTLTCLLNHGLDVNERVERTDICDGTFNFTKELNAMVGFSPIQILSAAALDARAIAESGPLGTEEVAGNGAITSIMDRIASCGLLLIEAGARISLVAPPVERKKEAKKKIKKKNSKMMSRLRDSNDTSQQVDNTTRNDLAAPDLDASLPPVNRSDLKIDENITIMNLLGGQDKLLGVTKSWLEAESVRDSKTMLIRADIPKDDMFGDPSSCAICWTIFGTVSNRRHSCRITRRYVCEECSSKRMYHDGIEYRISDGQYHLGLVEGAKADLEEQELFDLERQRHREEKVARLVGRKEETTDDEEDAKTELFGGALMKNMKTLFLGDEDEQEEQLDSLTSKMSATRDAFNERGERLNDLAEKTAALQDASKDFAAMAKELRKQQESKGFFGW